MPYKDLERANNLCLAFKMALEERYEKDAQLQTKVIKSMNPREIRHLRKKIDELRYSALQYAVGGNPSETFLKKHISLANDAAGFVGRSLSRKEMAALIPPEFKNEADVKVLRKARAPHLAKLCKMKP